MSITATLNRTIEELYTQLQSAVNNNQLALSTTTIETLPIHELLSLLESETLMFREVAITKLEDSIAISGKISLLGSDHIAVTAIVTTVNNAIEFALNAVLPNCHAPGADWLALQSAILDLKISATKEISGTLGGTLHTSNLDLPIVLTVDKTEAGIGFSYSLPQLDLMAIASGFMGNVSLPAELPNIVLMSEGRVAPKAGTFSLSASSIEAWNFPANSQELSITKVDLNLERSIATDLTHTINCAIAISGGLPKTIADELTIQEFHLIFELVGSEWSVKGNVLAELFEHQFDLAASYEQTTESKTLTLTAVATPAIDVINVESMGKLSLSKLEIAVAKSVVKPLDESFLMSEQTSQSAWSVSADGAIVVNDVLDAAGNLMLYKKVDQSAGLVFTPDHATAKIPLPPDRTASMTLEFGGISIVRGAVDSANPNAANWVFQSAVDLSFQGWNETVHRYLPDQIKTTLNADRTGVTLTADRVTNPFEFHLPNIDKVELGNAVIDVSDLLVHLGKEIHVAAAVGVGLPSKLNNLFGVKADGTPSMEFFNTYDAADAKNTIVKLQLSIGTAGIKLTPESSFIKAIHLVNKQGGPLQPNQEPWWFCDFGEFGAVNVKVPEFAYDMTTTSFKASGAFETVRPLSIPMTPMKLLLSACKLQGAADLLPAGLPLKSIKILDDHGNFKAAELTQLLQAVTDGHLPSELTQAIATIGQNLDHLPDSFKQYLNIEIPPSFAFEVSVTPEGTVQFSARTEPEHPIRLLFPGLLLGMPVLNGITLRSISFGELAGGSLFLLNVDADVDQFDIVTLGAALLLPIVPNNPLPSPQHIQRRLILNNLMMIIVYETVIPIPVPMFYDQIGIEYLGLEGIQFQTHAQFPMPSLDLREAGVLLSKFKQFFTDRTYLLDPNAAPEHLDLKFSLKHNYMELPSYMGGSLLGDRDSGPMVSAYESVARLLNGMKTLSVNELIKAVPAETRINHTDVSFGPLSGSLGWMVTTPDEFKTLATQPLLKDIAYQRLGLADESQAAQLLNVLPPASSGDRDEQGLVVFLKGNVAVNNLATFETVFGLAGSLTIGFNTGFKLSGKISDVMAIELAGKVSTPSQGHPSFQLNGHSKLMMLNQPIFQGDVQIADRRFQCQGMLDLYGLGGSVAMTIDRDQGADLRGELNAIDLGIFKLSGINNNPKPTVLIQIHPSQSPVLDLSGAVQLLGLRSETHIRVSDSDFLFTTTGNLFDRFSATLQVSGKRLTNSADFHVAATMQTDFTQFLKAETTKVLKQAADDAQSKISDAQRQADSAQAEVNRLQGVVNTQRSIVRQERVNANNRLADARQTVANEQAKVSSLQTTIRQKESERNRLANEQTCKTLQVPNVPDFWHTHSVTTCIPNPTSIAAATKLQAEITGLQARLGTEQGLLIGAQKALVLLQQTIGSIAMDPAAIDADARVWGPLGLLNAATGGLTGYRAVLEATRRTVAAGAAVGDYIAAHGLDALLVVNAASFVADLNTATGGQVILSVSLNYRGTATNLSLNFNFNDPVSSARQLGQRLLQG